MWKIKQHMCVATIPVKRAKSLVVIVCIAPVDTMSVYTVVSANGWVMPQYGIHTVVRAASCVLSVVSSCVKLCQALIQEVANTIRATVYFGPNYIMTFAVNVVVSCVPFMVLACSGFMLCTVHIHRSSWPSQREDLSLNKTKTGMMIKLITLQ